jgi:uncharacterized membrane protein
MTLFETCALLATLLCTLVAGFLFAFATVVMPGLATLDDAGFVRGFRAIDGVIQRNQPLFMVMWVGSVVALLAALGLGLWELRWVNRGLVIAAAVLYLAGVQVPTLAINVPLNNRLQALDLATLNGASLRQEREAFEPRWNRWNAIRTACATLTSVLLLLVLLGARHGA